MTVPINFTAATPRHALPNLFAAQAQKEFAVNEALARIDSLLHAAIETELSVPPASPNEGECWLVGSAPSGDWSGEEGAIACWQSGNWVFLAPRTGMRLFDKSAGKEARFDGGWQRASAVAGPTGGSVVDSEARTAIAGLIAALVSTGILA